MMENPIHLSTSGRPVTIKLAPMTKAREDHVTEVILFSRVLLIAMTVAFAALTYVMVERIHEYQAVAAAEARR